MDQIHRPNEREGVSEKIHLKTYFDKLREQVLTVRPKHVVDAKSMSRSNFSALVAGCRFNKSEAPYSGTDEEDVNKLDKAMFDRVEELCSIDKLTVEHEPLQMKICLDDEENILAMSEVRKFEPIPIPDEGKAKLKTLQILAEASDADTRRRINNLRHFNDIWFESMPKQPDKLRAEVIEKDVVVTVRVYRPMKNHPRQPSNSWRYVQEIVLLGTSCLTDLRDFIKCPIDYMISEDISEDPVVHSKTPMLASWESQKKNKDVYKSGFIFIEGCFYNDMRWSECIDYSQVIREWATNNPKRCLGPFTTAKMEEIILQDLSIRFGYPYVYMHQGDHEHLITFMEAHLLSDADPQYHRSYPYERSVGYQHSKYCIICTNRTAKWITTENKRVPEDPFYFCDECFKEFNYDNQGRKKCDFKAYNFIESNAL